MSKRRSIPLSVKLKVALARFGLKPSDVQFDHVPALELRPIDPETGETVPHPNDPSAIQMLLVAEHAEKTTGRKGTSKNSRDGNGDAQRIAKVKRLEKGRLGEFCSVDSDPNARGRSDTRAPDSRTPPKRPIPSRKFPTNKDGPFKQPMRGRTERRG